jgi:putative flippase GtrA
MAFYRFCRWGGFGFVADGIVLLTLIYVFDVHPLLSRIFSFGIAVALTFQLNRSWTFSSLRRPPSQRTWQYKASGLCVISPSTHLLS